MASTRKHYFFIKDMNLPKCPGLLHIEKYWPTTKMILKKKNKTINKINQFKRYLLERAPSTVENSTVQKFMEPIEQKVMAFDRDKLELSTFITKRIKNDVDMLKK